MTYPKTDYWDSLPVEKKLEHVITAWEAERDTVRRVTKHWLRAADRVKELEAER